MESTVHKLHFFRRLMLTWLFTCFLSWHLLAQFSMSDLNVKGLTLTNLTSLRFGPDQRLYVTQQNGIIYAFTVNRLGANSYEITSTEQITLVQQIPNYNDDGQLNTAVKNRQVTGIVVTGTLTKPVLYVGSSDPRIGGPSGDTNLDTNSGMISRLTWIGPNAPSATNFNNLSNAQLWDKVDIVRGLPRSEENHANNGMQLATINGKKYLFVSVGGNTNAGSPSQNFTKITEFALSSAVISVDLTAIEALPIVGTGPNKRVYDLPTVDDPTRPNANGITDPATPGYNGIDVGDPFGGNDGLNQAKIVPGGPVQIFSPGYRNTYDLVITKNGRMYVTDNGANQGWGGLPENEGPAVLENGKLVSKVTNNYHVNSSGQELGSGQGNPDYNGQTVNNNDALHLVTGFGDPAQNNIFNYVPGSYYAGHPTPIRANPAGAGLYTHFGTNTSNDGVFRTVKFKPNASGDAGNPNKALPADWPPVPLSMANPVEGDFRNPGMNMANGFDGAAVVWPTNTNAIAEYTASNLNGAYKGNLFAGSSSQSGRLFRVPILANGGVANSNGSPVNINGGTSALGTANLNFATLGGGYVLGIACQDDTDIFPGTIWAASYNGSIKILEPSDYAGNTDPAPVCIQPGASGYDPMADYDNDGYKNYDEIDNQTNHCSSAQVPSDYDKDFISDLNDPDDDNDGINDIADLFQLDNTNGLNRNIPTRLDLFNQGTGFYRLDLVGIMNNLKPNDNYLNWLDKPQEGEVSDIMGGAVGAITVHWTVGDALGSLNTQAKGFHFGLNVNSNTPLFYVTGRLLKPFRIPVGQESYGMFVGNGDQDNYIKLVRNASGMQVVVENNGVPVITQYALAQAPTDILDLYFIIDPAAGTVQPAYASDSKPLVYVGGPIAAQGKLLTVLQQASQALAVGIIGTTGGNARFAANYDYFDADFGVPGAAPAFAVRINAGQTSGNTFTDSQGNVWQTDQHFLTGGTYPSPSSSAATTLANTDIKNTTDDFLYRTERNGSNGFEYQIPVPANGQYTVRLHFAEIYWQVIVSSGGAGSRIFHIDVEGNRVLSNYDIIANVGSATAVVQTFNVTVNDGALNIKGIPVTDQAKISAIEVLSQTTGSTITVQPVSNQSHTEGTEVGVTVIASGGSGNLTYGASGLPGGLMIEPTNGFIHGTLAAGTSTGGPTNNGVYPVTITVSDAGGSLPANASFTWTVTGGTTAIPNTWTSIVNTNNHISRHENSFTQVGDKFYILGGRESNLVEEYNYVTNTWTPGPAAPISLNHFQATEYKGMLWAIGAFKDNTFPTEKPADNIYMYDPVAKAWITGPEIPANRRRGSAGLVVYQDKFYVISGITNGHTNGWVPWFDEYDPATNTWKQLPNAPRARDHFHAAVEGNRLYVAGGRRSGEVNTFSPVIAEVDVFDFTTGTWLTGSALPDNLPTPRGGAATVTFKGEVVVIGGEVSNLNDALKHVEALNVTTGKWRRLADLVNGRHGTQAIATGDGIHITSGSPKKGGGNMNNMEVYGIDNPVGTPVAAGTLNAPQSQAFQQAGTVNIPFTLTGGNQAVYIRNITLSGTNASEFNVVNAATLMGRTLYPGTTVQVQVAFNPANSNPKSATLSFQYGASMSKTVALSGTSSTGGGQSVVSFTLMNSETNLPVPGYENIPNGAQLPLNSLPQGLNIRANTNPEIVGSVVFNLIGSNGGTNRTQTETAAPYALFGDVNSDYSPWLPSRPQAGFSYQLTGTPFTQASGQGTAGTPLTISFSFVNQSTPAPNQPPVANAGGNQTITLPTSSVVLNGSASSDPDGTIAGYVWAQQSGPSTAVLATPNAAVTTASGLQAGTYVFRLTVTDNQGATAFADATITVNPAPSGGQSVVSFTLMNSETNLPVPGYENIPNGAQLPLNSLPQGLNIRANTNPEIVGSVVFNLIGSNGGGNRTQTETAAPYALFGDSNGNYGPWLPSRPQAGFSYQLTGTPFTQASGKGTAGTPLTISFSFVNQSTPAPNQHPVANAGGNQTITLPISSITLNGSASSDPDGTIVSFNWTQQSGPSTAVLATPNTAITTASGLQAGTYVFRLTVTDNQGATAFADATITVNPAPSGGQAVVSFTLMNANTNQPVAGYNPIPPGAVIDLQATGNALNIRANTSPEIVGSVVFNLVGSNGGASFNQTETAAPYALFGDTDSDYEGWKPAPPQAGFSYQLTATPFTLGRGRGTAGTPLTISFSFSSGQGSASRLGDLADEQAAGQEQQWEIYPNPARDQLMVAYPGLLPGTTRLSLYNLLGQIVHQEELTGTEQGMQAVDISGLPRGVYLLHIVNGSFRKSVKLIFE